MKKKFFPIFVVLFALIIGFCFSACRKEEEKVLEKPEPEKPSAQQTEKKEEPEPIKKEEPEYTGEIAFYGVSFNANGGECDVSILFTEIDGTLNELPVPTKEGAEFEGWYADGVMITTDTVFSDTTEVIAKWKGEELLNSSDKEPVQPTDTPVEPAKPEAPEPEGRITVNHGNKNKSLFEELIESLVDDD